MSAGPAVVNPTDSGRGRIMTELLQVLRRELVGTIQPDLNSAYARYVAGVMGEMLDHMADWASGAPYPETDTARRALIENIDQGAETDLRFIPEMDDRAALDGILAQSVNAASRGGDTATLAKLIPAVAAIDDALYASEAARHAATVVDDTNLLARIDPELTAAAFDHYAVSVLQLHDPVIDIAKIPGGNSKDTFLVGLHSGRQLIVRRDFPFGPVDTSAPDEFPLLAHLADLDFPVARPVAAEHDPRHLGQPFLLVERVAGMDAHTAGLADPATGRSVSLQLARILARLHQIDPVSVGLTNPSTSPHQQVRAYLAQWREWWDRNRLHPSSLGEAAFAWLERNIPTDVSQMVVVHGDARPGNMLVQDGTVTALLDWEFAHAGDPSEDLQYAKGCVACFVGWEEFRAAYLDAGGPNVSEASGRFYDVFRSLRNLICTDVSWSGFIRRDYPAFKLASQGVIYKRMLAQELAKSLRMAEW